MIKVEETTQVCHARYAHYNRDENLLSLCLSINKNIDSRLPPQTVPAYHRHPLQ